MRQTPLPPIDGRVLIDTAAWYAFADRSEATHTAVSAVWKRLAQERWLTFTTNYLMAETHALLLARLGYRAAANFLRQLERGSTTVLRITEAEEHHARDLIYRYSDKKFSFADATSFVVMERERIGVAFTLDRNFAQYGFQVLGRPGPS